MKPFTVVFAQTLPIGQGVAAFHHVLMRAKDAETAAKECKGFVGGYAYIVCVLDGYQVPTLRGNNTHVWDSKIRYRDKTIVVPIIDPIVPEEPKKPRRVGHLKHPYRKLPPRTEEIIKATNEPALFPPPDKKPPNKR